MSRRQLSSSRRPCKPKDDKLDERIANIADKNSNIHQKSTLAQMLAWPMRMLSSTCTWLCLELSRTFDEKASRGLGKPASRGRNRATTAHNEQSNLLPSLVSLIIGLVLVKNYIELLDTLLATYLGNWGQLLRGYLDIFASMSFVDLDCVITALIIVLFWVGAFRIISDLLVKISQTPKYRAYDCTGDACM